jgi:transcriptional regulator with XRE-family HTH domain
MTTFADRLKTFRRAAGLSQTELAGDGISPSYVSLLESGRRTPSPAVAALLAAKLGCSVSELLDGEPSERERRVQLELAYAELALRHEGTATAIDRLDALLSEADLGATERSEALLLLGKAHELQGDLPGAISVVLPLFEDARQGRGPQPVTKLAWHLCHYYRVAGDLGRTVAIGEQALDACREQGLKGTEEYFKLAATVMLAYADRGDEVHATTWARQLIAEAEAAGEPSGQAALYWNASILAEREGRLDDALQLSRKALARLGELGDSRDLARLKLDSASVLLAAEPPLVSDARDALERARNELRRLGSELDVAEWEHLRSTVSLLDGDVDQAQSLARSALDRLPQDAGAENLCLAHRALGDALAARGRRSDAVKHYMIALDLQSVGFPGRAASLAWRDLAERLLAAGDTEAAIRAYRGALDAVGVRNRAEAVLAAIATSEPGGATEPARVMNDEMVTDQLS